MNESFVAHALLCWLYVITGVHEKALLEGERSIALAPNSADAHAWYAFSLLYAGEFEKAISYIEKAQRLNPFSPGWYFVIQGGAYYSLGRYEEAIASHKKAIYIEPTSLTSHAALIVNYVLLGKEREARAEAEEVLRIDPEFSSELYANRMSYMNQTDRERIVASLRKAGLK